MILFFCLDNFPKVFFFIQTFPYQLTWLTLKRKSQNDVISRSDVFIRPVFTFSLQVMKLLHTLYASLSVFIHSFVDTVDTLTNTEHWFKRKAPIIRCLVATLDCLSVLCLMYCLLNLPNYQQQLHHIVWQEIYPFLRDVWIFNFGKFQPHAVLKFSRNEQILLRGLLS